MTSSFGNPDVIGVIAAVQSERLTIELDPSTSGLVKAGSVGVVPVGSINSYVTVPAGAQQIVAVVTSIRIFPEPMRSAGASVIGPSELRHMEATMVGRFEEGEYYPGVVTYPSLFAPVMIASQDEIATIFSPGDRPAVRLGEAVVAPDQDVLLDADILLARHCAVLGSTGAGKSCTVTAIIDGILELGVPHANIVIFDSNGEYKEAFAGDHERWERANPCVIGLAPDEGNVAFSMPHWFMNTEEHVALLSASELTQAPLLQRAVIDARLASESDVSLITQLRIVSRSLRDIREISTVGRKPQETLAYSLAALKASIDAFVEQARTAGDLVAEGVWQAASEIVSPWDLLDLVTGGGAWNLPVTAQQQQQLEQILGGIDQLVEQQLNALGLGAAAAAYDFDAPRYYSFEDLYEIYLPNRVQMASLTEPRVAAYVTTLLMRLSRLLADSRYDFMTRVRPYPDALGRYLRLILGVSPLDDSDSGSLPWSDSYTSHVGDRDAQHSVTILDLSLVASDVLEEVTALLGRLLLEFVQRVSPRGTFPILLVLEEAHRYIPTIYPSMLPTRSSVVFERIAKEGRKYGLGLLLASQRPSELSRSVLAQCGTLIAHRMTSADDQDLMRHASPYASRDVLNQLPGLATQHAVVLGEAVPAPTYVRVRNIEHAPRGRDPKFIGRWQSGVPNGAAQLIDSVAHKWEQSSQSAQPTDSGEHSEA